MVGDDNNETDVQHRNYEYDQNSFVVIEAASEDGFVPFWLGKVITTHKSTAGIVTKITVNRFEP